MRPVLVLVDLQNDFLEVPGLEPASGEVVRRAARLLEGARERGLPVVHVRTSVDPAADDRMPHWKALGRRRCVLGTPGCDSPPELAAGPGEPVVPKTFFSGFSGGLDGALSSAGADSLWIAGVHLHGCVRATALDAYQRGFEVWIAEDAVGSDDPLHAAVTRRYLDGRAARFASVDELLGTLGPAPGAEAPLPARMPAAVVAGRAVHRDGLTLRTHRCPGESALRLFSWPSAGAVEAAEAAAAAREALPAWRDAAPEERASRLLEIADWLDATAASLARDLAVDLGKPLVQGEAEARRAAELIRNAAAARAGPLEPCGPASASRRVPLGVVALVTPWNNPVAIPWGKLGPALAFGNTVVWKPAPAATRVAIRTLGAARRAGLPDGVVNLVCGDHRAAAAVMSDDRVDAVSLSGSSPAGWAAQEICARRRIPLQAELGGNNAAIVWEGADLPRAAERVAHGAFAFAGQRCTANRRAVVQETLFDELAARLGEAMEGLVWGDPLSPESQVGPLVSEEARGRVAAAVERARRGAERIHAPHASRPGAAALRASGAYYPPTLVVGASPDAEIVREETFGPVLVLQRARTFDDALELANGVRQGLIAALFAGPGPWWERFQRRAEAGILKRDTSTADADAFAPFGGWKASGIGPPEHGAGDVEFYTRPQAIYGGA